MDSDLTLRLQNALNVIHAQARPEALEGMARFAIGGDGRLGLSVPAMRGIARAIRQGDGHDHALAMALWDSGTPDARIIASMVAEPGRFTSREMDAWIRDFASWDVCDQACMNAFCRSPLAWGKVVAWAKRKREFERRAAFALLAMLAVHDKRAADAAFLGTLPLLETAACDDRNFVKKAVNWALRSIGKRNAVLQGEAIACARRIHQQGSASARWIASDALRELSGHAVAARRARKPAQANQPFRPASDPT